MPRDFAVINPGAGWDSKVWPWERYAEVACNLTLPSVVVWAGDKEQAWAEQIVAHSTGQAHLAPRTSLPELAALARRARLFIGGDTGPLHIAAAVGTPCVAVYGPTNPAVCGPWGEAHCVLQVGGEELGSARKAAGKMSAAMLRVTAAELLAACQALLERARSHRSAA